MYKEELKKEILEKFSELRDVAEERDEIEENSGLSYMELRYKSNDTLYGELCHREMQLIDAIRGMLLDTKYAPLTGLTDEQIKELSFYADSTNLDDSILREKIENNLNIMLLKLRGEIKERERQVKPLYLTAHIDERNYELYRQVIKCYVYGTFEASCVLCRAIAEVIAKRLIEKKGYGDWLAGQKKELKRLSIAGILREKLLIDNKVVETYSKIARKADKILHKKNEKTEEKNALESIKLLQFFIKQVTGMF